MIVIVGLVLLVLVAALVGILSASGREEPQSTALSQYWTADSPVAKSLRNYVTKATDPKDRANFIPEKDRIAVFDMDGTRTCETYYTYYDTMMFIEYCLNDHPEQVSDELKRVAAAIKPGYQADDPFREWGRQDWAEKSAEYEAKGYIPVSMKDDFAQIYPEGVTKAAEQYQERDWSGESWYEEETKNAA